MKCDPWEGLSWHQCHKYLLLNFFLTERLSNNTVMLSATNTSIGHFNTVNYPKAYP